MRAPDTFFTIDVLKLLPAVREIMLTISKTP